MNKVFYKLIKPFIANFIVISEVNAYDMHVMLIVDLSFLMRGQDDLMGK